MHAGLGSLGAQKREKYPLVITSDLFSASHKSGPQIPLILDSKQGNHKFFPVISL